MKIYAMKFVNVLNVICVIIIVLCLLLLLINSKDPAPNVNQHYLSYILWRLTINFLIISFSISVINSYLLTGKLLIVGLIKESDLKNTKSLLSPILILMFTALWIYLVFFVISEGDIKNTIGRIAALNLSPFYPPME